MKRAWNKTGAVRSYRLFAVAVVVALLAAASLAAAPAADDRDLVVGATGTFWVPDAVFNPAADDGLPTTWGTAETFYRPTYAGPQPLLAASAIKVGSKTWSVALRPGVKFQNGRPLNARAAVAFLNYELKNDPVVGSILPDVTAIKVVDKLTFTIKSKKKIVNLPAILSDMNAAVYDVATVRKVAPDWNKLVGSGAFTGPFKLSQLQAGRAVILTRNEKYWQGRPYLKRLVFIRIPDEQAAVRAVQAGEADMYIQPSGSLKVTVQGLAGVRWVSSGEAPIIFAAAFNLNRPPMNDVSVRRAFSLAVDWPTILRTALFGVYPPLKGLYPSSDPIAVDWQKFDPGLAGRLLNAAGWKPGSDGVRVKEGKKLELAFIIYSNDQKTMAVAAQDMLAKVGISSQIVGGTDYPSYLNNVKSNNWDVGLYQGFQNYGLNSARETVFPLHFLPDSTQVSNPANFNDPAITALVPNLRSGDPKVVAAAIRKIQQINSKKVYWVGIAQRVQNTVVSDTWKRFKFDAFYRPFDHRTRP